jgi:hypothetical protein
MYWTLTFMFAIPIAIGVLCALLIGSGIGIIALFMPLEGPMTPLYPYQYIATICASVGIFALWSLATGSYPKESFANDSPAHLVFVGISSMGQFYVLGETVL